MLKLNLFRVRMLLFLILLSPTAFAQRLNTPTLTFPANNAPGVSTSPTFTWSQVTGNIGYRIIISPNASDMTTDPSYSSTTVPSGGFNDAPVADQNYWTPSTALSAGTTYYWEVHARAPYLAQASYWGQGSFTTAAQRLNTPTLTFPANNAPGVSTSPTFTWSQVTGNIGYRIIISPNASDMTTDPSYSSTTVPSGGFNDAPVADQNYWTPSTALSAGTTYYWEVHARAPYLAQASYWGQGSFTTAAQGLNTPTLTFPANNAPGVSTSPTFTWSQVTGNIGYRIIISPNASDMTTDPSYSSTTVPSGGFNDAPVADQNYWTPSTALSAGTTYYWEVHARAPYLAQASYWGQGSFTTAAQRLNTPTLTFPANNAPGVSTSPTFTWSQVTGNIGYRIIISPNASDMTTDPSYSSTTVPSGGFNDAPVADQNYWTPSTALSPGTTYYWEVHARAPYLAQASYWGQGSFTTAAATVPGAPTIGTAAAGNAQAIVTFTAPAANGGSPITSYKVTSSPGGKTATGSASPLTVTGLTNGTAYTFTVTATNGVGTGPASATSNSVTPTIAATVPGAPTIGTATAGNTQAIVTFTAPASNGGSPITSYTVTSSPGGKTATSSASPLTVTGLTNGTAYTFTVTATNAIGTGPASAVSNSVTPTAAATVPGAPTIGTATAGNTQAIVTFTAPASNGGSPITSYKVTSSSGGKTATGSASPLTVTGLTNGTAYTFTVTATNGVGTGPASATSNSVTPTIAATVPGAPTVGTATAGNAQAIVTFTAPASNGGSPITSYTVTSSPGGKTATSSASPLTVTGLTNGTAYTFTVTATNGIGAGPPSAASNSVTPTALTPVTEVRGLDVSGNNAERNRSGTPIRFPCLWGKMRRIST